MTEQKRTDVDWEDLRFFAALARHRSLSATARALKVNHATVARRIAALESVLGFALFERRADGYQLSRHGTAILSEAGAMESAASAIRDRLAYTNGPSGRVRLTTTRSIADLVIAPRLGDVLGGLANVELEIVTDIRVHSLAQREADIALRLGHPKDSDLTGKRVATIGYAFYASKAAAETVDESGPARLIGFDLDTDGVAEARWLETRFGRDAFTFRSSSNIVQASAAAAGLGIAMLPRFVAEHNPALVEIDYGEAMPDRELWMLAPANLVDIPRIRAIWDGLAQVFSASRERL
ncbi:LysR family transcriptional regulator [Rhizobium sullae]|uniref:LysR family transcriptional regulator n=1 Tax=Rhizobium sullae TaxID=50338 RepID=A0A2N0D2B1_RHISU|nr:LysR family transcriptional regulator [Rhizobium sullae]PKA40261.1 LysR family transcriptional regulator [Rhizobium sullae]UWU15060.1 LysR family transcriptional regulator [Rhizobium sullae]